MDFFDVYACEPIERTFRAKTPESVETRSSCIVIFLIQGPVRVGSSRPNALFSINFITGVSSPGPDSQLAAAEFSCAIFDQRENTPRRRSSRAAAFGTLITRVSSWRR